MLTKLLSRLRMAVRGKNAGAHQATDPLASKLGDLKWQKLEGEERLEQLNAAGQNTRDPVAQTVYLGRPGNPLSGED